MPKMLETMVGAIDIGATCTPDWEGTPVCKSMGSDSFKSKCSQRSFALLRMTCHPILNGPSFQAPFKSSPGEHSEPLGISMNSGRCPTRLAPGMTDLNGAESAAFPVR